MGCCMSADRPLGDSHGLSQRDKPATHSQYSAGIHAQCMKDYCHPINPAETGPASMEGTAEFTIPQLLHRCAETMGDKPALRVEREKETGVCPGAAAFAAKELTQKTANVKGTFPPEPRFPAMEWGARDGKAGDQWTTWTYKQYYEDSAAIAKALMAAKVEQFDAVAIFGFNSPEWVMASQATFMAGAKTAGIYPTDTAEQIAYKCNHSGSKVIVLEDKHCLDKYATVADKVKGVQTIVIWNDVGEDRTELPGGQRVVSWDKFKIEGENSGEDLEGRMTKIKSGHCCALIYTSGTTGMPKAVMVSHDNIYFEANTVMNLISDVVGNGLDIGGNVCHEERLISYLPLSHVAGMMVDIICPVALTANPKNGSYTSVAFARPYDLKIGTLKNTLQAVQPTMFIGVPRVWEKISETMKAIGASITGAKKKVSTWGKAKGTAHWENMEMGGTGEYPCCYGLASKLVHSKVKQNLGLDKCKFGFTGAAPIMVDTLEYFGQLGIQINEVYGMSECTGACTWSTDKAHKAGSCGFAMPGMEVVVMDKQGNILDPAVDPKHPTENEQGELCFRGRNIMMGYLANPDLGAEHVAEIEGKTKEAIDGNGWLHSGDKGCIDAQGMFRITGRYKELIIGAGGENVAPVPMENFLKTGDFGISDAMMVGDRQKYNVCLITLNAEGHTGDLQGTDNLAGKALGVSSDVTTISGAKDDPTWKQHIDKAIKTCNNDKEVCPAPPAMIQKFAIVPNFSVETGEFTPTLKLKRSVVEDQYIEEIKALYGSAYVEKQ